MERGAGEILLTSMDRDGTKDGYDLELTRAVSEAVTVPVIASGGAGSLEHLREGLVEGRADAVLAASIFHFGIHSHRRGQALSAGARRRGPPRAVTSVTIDDLRFDERGLIPAVVQEAATGELLMVAWMDRAALEATLRTGLAHFWSRSRRALWQKGETSGHVQHVQAVYVDCDADTLLVQVHQEGVACHTGHRTCFFRALEDPASGARPQPPCSSGSRDRGGAEGGAPAGSYVVRLLARGEAAVCRKIGEEAVEVVTAALGGEGDERVVAEMADLWFHTIVLLGARGLTVRAVLEELARRHTDRAVSRAADVRCGGGRRLRRRRDHPGPGSVCRPPGGCRGAYQSSKGYRVTLPGPDWRVVGRQPRRSRAAAPGGDGRDSGQRLMRVAPAPSGRWTSLRREILAGFSDREVQ